MRDEKEPGPVRALGFAHPITSLPEEGRLLVSDDRTDRKPRSNRGIVRFADRSARVEDPGQDPERDLEQSAELLVPRPRMKIEQQRPRSVGCIRGWQPSTGR